MARSISVKVPTAKLIEQIENRIAEIDQEIADYPAKRQAYEKEQEQYKTEVASFVSKYLSENANRVGFDYDSVIRLSDRSYFNRSVELTINTDAIADFPQKPEAPEQPNQREHFGRDWTTRKELLEKNLRILKMTNQEEVNASTYGAVMEII